MSQKEIKRLDKTAQELRAGANKNIDKFNGNRLAINMELLTLDLQRGQSEQQPIQAVLVDRPYYPSPPGVTVDWTNHTQINFDSFILQDKKKELLDSIFAYTLDRIPISSLRIASIKRVITGGGIY